MTTGEKIRALRKAIGMTQEELGEKIGVQKAAINKYETGLVVNLKRGTIHKLAKALGVSPVYLLDDDNSDESNLDQRLLNAFHAASAEARELALNMLEQSAAMQRKEKDVNEKAI